MLVTPDVVAAQGVRELRAVDLERDPLETFEPLGVLAERGP